MPLWEGFDEWSHYAVAQKAATSGRWLIPRAEPVSREVEASLELAPRHPGPADAGLTFDAYWQLPEAERAARERELRSLPSAWTYETAAGGSPAYEAQQTPLYYWVLALLYRAIAWVPFLARVWLLRLFGLLLASAVIPLGYKVAWRVLGGEERALGAVALIASMPQLMMTVCHVGNDCLAVAMGSLLLWALFRWKDEPRSMRRAAVLGVALGLALLTKAYFLALVPVVLLFALMQARRSRVYRQALAVFGCGAALAGWWYVRTWMLTHSFSGEQTEIAAAGERLTLTGAALQMNWLRALDFVFLSHVWLGNWSFLVVRSWMYHLLALGAACTGVGLLHRLFRAQTPYPSRSDLLLLLAMEVALVAALAYHAAQTFQTEGFAGALGYYLFAMAVAEAILLAVGLEALGRAAIALAVTSLAALEFFGTLFYSMAYYSGRTAHLPNGNLPALRIGQLAGGGWLRILQRLAVNKPEFLNAAVMGALWLLFVVASAALVWVAWKSKPVRYNHWR